MKKRILTCLLLCSGFTLGILNAQNNLSYTKVNGKDCIIYIVQPGEGVYGISKRFNVTQDELRQFNPAITDSLRAGQELLIPVVKPSQAIVGYFMHETKRKETLYSISKLYNVSIDDIVKLNPGVKEKLKAKTLIRIPEYSKTPAVTPEVTTPANDEFIKHIITPKETLFSLARRYGVSIDDLIQSNPGLSPETFSIGKVVLIPRNKVSQAAIDSFETENNQTNIVFPQGKRSVQAALFLPFHATSVNKNDINQRRYTEFYEGLLLAVDSLKRTDYNVNLYVYDSFNKSSKELLSQPGVENADLLIAAPTGNQLKDFSIYAEQSHKSLILPFTSKNDEIDNNQFLVQINTPQAYLYDEVIKEFIRRFGNKQIVFLEETDKEGAKKDFCIELKKALQTRQIPFKVQTYQAADIELPGFVADEKQEYVFIPERSTSDGLKIVLPLLQAMKKLNPTLNTTLFGYPEWQTFVNDYIEAFYELNTYIYSSFYADNNSPSLNRFYTRYKSWFHKDILNTYPKFGALGFDTGLFFLRDYAKFGEKALNEIQRKQFDGIHHGFYFQPISSKGGLINENIYWIHYSPDFYITKIQIH
ncbi:MAG: PBP1 and LysM peptidoglycan-binding domain-containing protein [Bacteroidales bacterium]